jgi:hypothetical protein
VIVHVGAEVIWNKQLLFLRTTSLHIVTIAALPNCSNSKANGLFWVIVGLRTPHSVVKGTQGQQSNQVRLAESKFDVGLSRRGRLHAVCQLVGGSMIYV